MSIHLLNDSTGGLVVAADGATRVELAPDQLALLTQQIAAALSRHAAPPPAPTLGELAEAWWAKVAPTRVDPRNEARLISLLKPLTADTEYTLTAAAIEALVDTLRPSYSPSTLNKLLATGRRIVDEAQRAQRWRGPNPFKLARRAKEAPRAFLPLTLEELARVQAKLAPEKRRMFRVVLHVGLRTGELFALRKEDVDFRRGVVLVRRSHERATTKTGRERVVPIVPAIAGDLLAACDASPGPLVFPSADGDLQRRDTKLTRALRTAMGAAGVGVVGVEYKCRRCGRVEVGPPPALRDNRCGCGFTFWPVPTVRPFRWYDLRHLCATLHHQHGADPVCLALVMGHSLHGTTARIYVHPDDLTLRRELSRWQLPG